MNLRELAQKVLEHRQSLAAIIPAGLLQSELGTDGFEEALRRRWIAPNYESGELSVTGDFALIDEMRKIVEDNPLQVGDPVVVAEDGQVYTGVVKEIRNGRYVMSFPEGKAPKTQRDYGDTEVQRVDGDGKTPQRPGGAAGGMSAPRQPLSSPPPVGSAHP